ncbi:MAG: phosphatidylserine decarboxylase family protein [Bacteroidota bacterium]
MATFRIHPEGRRLLIVLAAGLILLNALVFWTSAGPSTEETTQPQSDGYTTQLWSYLAYGLVAISIIFYLLVLQFFRNPKRTIAQADNQLIYAPADGKVVVIEATEEQEFFQDQRRQLSIFMSPLNVHVNRNPVSGKIDYSVYHPGKYLVAWHPKSSELNERTTVVYNTGQQKILMRQIAGAVARRIVNYLKQGQSVNQGEDMGFIKFGSRVDLFLPLDAEILVEIGQAVRGNETILARLS